mmetsp:Transcript_28865/g.68021  ORF Transcript_28865/g.68021 Transcript_28865/m.68021 type:complete len:212 (+) Transcript_28865:1275-1910(+)
MIDLDWDLDGVPKIFREVALFDRIALLLETNLKRIKHPSLHLQRILLQAAAPGLDSAHCRRLYPLHVGHAVEDGTQPFLRLHLQLLKHVCEHLLLLAHVLRDPCWRAQLREQEDLFGFLLRISFKQWLVLIRDRLVIKGLVVLREANLHVLLLIPLVHHERVRRILVKVHLLDPVDPAVVGCHHGSGDAASNPLSSDVPIRLVGKDVGAFQ